jgi:hypothetical protein
MDMAGKRELHNAETRLAIEIAKRQDGAGVLRCTRADGSVTWQKQEKHGAFYALHDLTHYAVETTLGYNGGFFGLIAQGWEVDETTGKGARGPLPPEALEVEKIVGLLDSERGAGALHSLEDFNAHSPRQLTAEQLQAVRAARARLFHRWGDVPAGQNLELRFPPEG